MATKHVISFVLRIQKLAQGPRFMTFYWLFFVEFISANNLDPICRPSDVQFNNMLSHQRSHWTSTINWIEIWNFIVSEFLHDMALSSLTWFARNVKSANIFSLTLLTHSCTFVGWNFECDDVLSTLNVICMYSSTLSSSSFEHSSRLEYRFQQTFFVRTISLSIHLVQVEITESRCSQAV